jgi:hypothetical protein
MSFIVEPKFAHPLVLPILHGNFTARLNRATETNFSTVDPLQQHLAYEYNFRI